MQGFKARLAYLDRIIKGFQKHEISWPYIKFGEQLWNLYNKRAELTSSIGKKKK